MQPVGDSSRTLSLEACKLVILPEGHGASEFVLTGDVIRLGTGAGNDIVLRGDGISRVHCEIRRDQRGHLLRDLRSTNGTLLDGAEIGEAYLHPGSVLTIGAVQLRFQSVSEQLRIKPQRSERLLQLRGRSLPMREIFGLLQQVSPTKTTVLIEGEGGSGKREIARTLHALSPRSDRQLITVDCSKPNSAELELELFGGLRSAAPDPAGRSPRSAFERADGSTIVLEQLGELSLNLQTKLLQTLQRGFSRAQSGAALRLNFRLLGTSNRDLDSEAAKGKFDPELLRRFAAVRIQIPPLRQRKEDIPLLLEHFRSRADAPPATEFSAEFQQLLYAHDWPGNVREFRGMLAHASKAQQPTAPRLQQRPPSEHSTADAGEAPSANPPALAEADFDPTLSFRASKERITEHFERQYVSSLLRHTRGNLSQAARQARMDRKHLHKLVQKHHVKQNK